MYPTGRGVIVAKCQKVTIDAIDAACDLVTRDRYQQRIIGPPCLLLRSSLFTDFTTRISLQNGAVDSPARGSPGNSTNNP